MMSVAGCDQEFHNPEFELLSVDNSECKSEKSESIDAYIDKYIISGVEEGIYRIEHENGLFNCCLPEGLEVNVYMQNDTLVFSDKEKTQGLCNCTCRYNTLAEIGGLAEGKHVLCFKMGDDYLGFVELDFFNDMYEEILVSELTDY